LVLFLINIRKTQIKEAILSASVVLVLFAFFEVVRAVLFLETLDATCGVDVLLLSRVERVADGADFGHDFIGCAACFEGIAAATFDHYFFVFWMYSFFHKRAPKSQKTVL